VSTSVEPRGGGVDLNIWLGRAHERAHDDPAFADLALQLSRLQEVVAGARPPEATSRETADTLAQLVDDLAPHEVDERTQPAGRQFGHPGRGQTLLPALDVDQYDGATVRGRVTFGRFYLGSNAAAHGGAICLVFDDLLGQLANGPGQPRSRTAYLHVDFRRIVPVGRELSVGGGITRTEGRKLFIEGELSDGESVLSHAEGLFVQLEPHHV
jgi:acyl-coenzyme A thioesterase PaaI-like protein